MFLKTDDYESAWLLFDDVRPLFAVELPWQAKGSDGRDDVDPLMLAAVDNFVACFTADIESAQSLVPPEGLSKTDAHSLFGTLVELLEFLESVVRDGIPEPERLSTEEEQMKPKVLGSYPT